ncbi:hypothetical protein [Devosia sp. A369]
MTGARQPQDARELAARALCEFEGVPEDILFDGKPMWMSYIEDVDAMLGAIEWEPGAVKTQPARKPKPARELAARAMCRLDGHPEDTEVEGRSTWEMYLPQADTVLEAIGWKPEADE